MQTNIVGFFSCARVIAPMRRDLPAMPKARRLLFNNPEKFLF